MAVTLDSLYEKASGGAAPKQEAPPSATLDTLYQKAGGVTSKYHDGQVIAGLPIAGVLSRDPIHYGTHGEPGTFDVRGSDIRKAGLSLEQAAQRFTDLGFYVAVRRKGQPKITNDHLHIAHPDHAPKEAARLIRQGSVYNPNKGKASWTSTVPKTAQDVTEPDWAEIKRKNKYSDAEIARLQNQWSKNYQAAHGGALPAGEAMLAEPSSRDVMIQGLLGLTPIPYVGKVLKAGEAAIAANVGNKLGQAIAKTGLRAGVGGVEGAAIGTGFGAAEIAMNPEARKNWGDVLLQSAGTGAAMGAAGRAVLQPTLAAGGKLIDVMKNARTRSILSEALLDAEAGNAEAAVSKFRRGMERTKEWKSASEAQRKHWMNQVETRARQMADEVKAQRAKQTPPKEPAGLPAGEAPAAEPAAGLDDLYTKATGAKPEVPAQPPTPPVAPTEPPVAAVVPVAETGKHVPSEAAARPTREQAQAFADEMNKKQPTPPPSPAVDAPAQKQAWDKPNAIVTRTEESGATMSGTDKPQGLYTAFDEIGNPHSDLGGQTQRWTVNSDANVLRVDTSTPVSTNRGDNIGQSTGVAAARQLLGDDAVTAMHKMPRADLAGRLSKDYPEVDWSRYYDQQEMVEAVAGIEARKQGYDAILGVDTQSPQFTEFVALNDNAFTPDLAPPPDTLPGTDVPIAAPEVGKSYVLPDGTQVKVLRDTPNMVYYQDQATGKKLSVLRPKWQGRPALEGTQPFETPDQTADLTTQPAPDDTGALFDNAETVTKPGQEKPKPPVEQKPVEGGLFDEPGGSGGEASSGGYNRPKPQPAPVMGAKPTGSVDVKAGAMRIELPELVELARQINAGKLPKILQNIRALNNTALGFFAHNDDLGIGEIRLREDVFLGDELARLRAKPGASILAQPGEMSSRDTSPKENARALQERVAERMDIPLGDVVVRYKRDKATGDIVYRAYRINPDLAPAVLAHEIGHLIDWLPDFTTKRGNILGHVATLRGYLKTTIGELPNSPDDFLTKKERVAIHRQAENTLKGSGLEGEELSAEISRVYKELIKDEIAARGLVTRDKIMEQLKAITQEWHPFDEERSPKYTALRYSAKELYADAVSMILNDPAETQRIAPDFYRMFMEYMERKPEVKTAYQAIQDRYTNREAITDERISNLYDMQERAAATRQKAAADAEVKPTGVIDVLVRGLIDAEHPKLKGIRQREKDARPGVAATARAARLDIEETAYLSSRVSQYIYTLDERVLQPMAEAGISYEDVGTYLFLRRVTADRAHLANPLGHTPATATETIEGLRRRLGPEKYAAVEKAAADYRALRESEIFPRVEKSRMYSPELMDLIKESKNYAKFSVAHYLEEKFGGQTTARIYKQVGTLAEIENPLVATILQDISMIRAAKINSAKRSLVKDLWNAGEIQPAKMRYSRDTMGQVPVEPKDPRLGLLTLMEDGTPVHFYVARPIAESFEFRPFEATKLAEIWASINQPIRDVLVSKNPIWMARNLVKDFFGTVKNVPEVRLRDVPALAKAYKNAIGEAWADAFKGERSEDIQEALDSFAITEGRVYSPRDRSFDNEIERLVNDFVFKAEDEASYRSKVVAAFKWLYGKADAAGRVSELSGKLAGYKYLKHLGIYDPRELAHIVRTRVGTPDYKRRGAWHIVTNNIFMFSNVGKEGARAAWEAFRENKSAYIWKTIAMNIVPKLLLIAAGIFGTEEMQECITGISDYDKKHYNCVPLGVNDKGKSIYLRLPQDYEGEFWSALVWDIVHGRVTGKNGAISTVASKSPYQLHPLAQVGRDLYQYYVKGNNPVDDYRGRNVIPQTVFEAGGADASKVMAKHAWNELGGSTFYRPAIGEVSRDQSAIEAALQTFPGNVLGTFLKISDRGHAEIAEDIAMDERQASARRRQDVRAAIVENVNADKRSLGDIKTLYVQLVRQGKIDRKGTSLSAFARDYKELAVKRSGGAMVNAVVAARSNKEREAILLRYRETMEPGEYDAMLQNLADEKLVSRELLGRVRAE